ncbi:hypothetical protein INR49_026194 [Caranx melampygus]|nr:hypothetical protein INR49_026194 [Caranx melampygus]
MVMVVVVGARGVRMKNKAGRVTILLSVIFLSLEDDEQTHWWLETAYEEKTNEDSQMVVGGNFTVGACCAWRRRETQQGGIRVAALSTSREIPTQVFDKGNGIGYDLISFPCKDFNHQEALGHKQLDLWRPGGVVIHKSDGIPESLRIKDGKLYQNHCELHRASCLGGHRITITHSEECFYKAESTSISPACGSLAACSRTPVVEEKKKKVGGGRVESPCVAVPRPLETEMEKLEEVVGADSGWAKMEKLFVCRSAQYASVAVDSWGAVVFSSDDNCRLSDYRRLKTKTLDLHDKRYMGSHLHGAHKDNMAARKQLVDMMFKRFDADNNGQPAAHNVLQTEAIFPDKLVASSAIAFMKRKCEQNMNIVKCLNVYLLNLPDDEKVSVTTVTVGQSAVLTCAITGERRPPILWKRNHQYLNSLNLEDINIPSQGVERQQHIFSPPLVVDDHADGVVII